MKTCTKCHVEKNRTLDYFPANKTSKDGLSSWCRKCFAEKAAKWVEEHPERHKQNMAKNYQQNMDTIKHRSANWGKEHSERVNELARLRYAKNPEPSRIYGAKRRAENPEYERERHAKYAKDNPEKRVVNEQKRRARKANLLADLSAEQWLEILIAYDYRCVYCPADCWRCSRKKHKLEQEHITPVVNGGEYTLHNIVPSCGPCNRRKHTKKAPIPVQPLLLTIAPAKKKR